MRRQSLGALGLLLAVGGCAGSSGTGPLPEDGATDCVETYSLETLPNREFAFDGVVRDVGPSVSHRGGSGDLGLPGVTFEVREWFTGGDSATVTVDMPLGTTDAYDGGTRLLVSGEPRWGGGPLDAPIAQGCGFTRYHDERTASAWRATFGG